jgi:nucleoside-diphosphate-sugar epimerase
VRVVVTGASGFIGGTIARDLALRGHEVVACGRRPVSELRSPLAGYMSWDIRNGPAALPRVDAVVHCAAHVGQWGPSDEYHRTNVDGLHAVLDSFPRPARFVHISSSSVYAHHQGDRALTEDAVTGEPLFTEYARSKVAAEQLLLSSGRPVIILRPHAVYGPGDTTLLPRLLRARRFGRLPVPGDGQRRISVTYVRNLADAVALALEGNRDDGIYNIADDVVPTLNELLATLLPRLGVRLRLVHVPVAVAESLAIATEAIWKTFAIPTEPRVTRYAVANLAEPLTLDVTRIRERLGYRARWNFRDAPMTPEAG